MTKPSAKPANPLFSSGPTAKRPGWSLKALEGAVLGRSHRSKLGKARLQEVIDLSKKILGLPEGYEYRTFSLSGSDGLPTKGFLRVQITP